MKKVVMVLFITLGMLYAKEMPYKIFVESFAKSDSPRLIRTYNKLKKTLRGYKNLRVVKRPSGKYHVVVVETIMDDKKFKKLYAKIKSLPGHKDAFYRPAPELLKEKSNPDAFQDANVNDDSILREIIKSTLFNNPRVRERVNNYTMIGKYVNSSQKHYYPALEVLSASESYERNPALRYLENLYNSKPIFKTQKQIANRMANASHLVLATSDMFIFEVIRVYLDAVKARYLTDLSSKHVTRLENILNQVNSSISISNKKSQKRKVLNSLKALKADLSTQKASYRKAVSALENVSGMKISKKQLVYPNFSYDFLNSFRSINAIAMKCNSLLRAQRANVLFSQNILSANLSNLDLNKLAKVQSIINYTDYKDRVENTSALLRISHGIYNGKLSKAQAKSIVQNEQKLFNTLKNNLGASLQNSWNSYVKNSNNVKSIIENSNSFKSQFDPKKHRLMNIFDMENKYYNARKNVIIANEYIFHAKYKLLGDMGLLADSFIPNIGKTYIANACSIGK
ncbi:MAG: hypothetical protein CR967_00535 [Proteobacteria bacterium]|nr:MAG: hypothetical protein CR967_00535 [Pseudomonadota bacterium]